MPGMDGMQATASIRAQEAITGRHIPIIALTAHAMAGDRTRFLEGGMDGYIAKPIRSRELFDTGERLSGKLAFPISDCTTSAPRTPHG